MVLNASRNASYNEVVGVLDLLRQVGGDRVALATLSGKADTPTLDNTSPLPNLPTNPTLPGVPSLPNSNSQSSTNPLGRN
jgi:biopolymer transport protein ExbD